MRRYHAIFFAFLAFSIGCTSHAFDYQKALGSCIANRVKVAFLLLRTQEWNDQVKQGLHVNLNLDPDQKMSDYVPVYKVSFDKLKHSTACDRPNETIIETLLGNIESNNGIAIDPKHRTVVESWFERVFFKPSSFQSLLEQCEKWSSMMAQYLCSSIDLNTLSSTFSDKAAENAQYHDIDLEDPNKIEHIWRFSQNKTNGENLNSEKIISFLNQFFYYIVLVSLKDLETDFTSPENPINQTTYALTQVLAKSCQFALNRMVFDLTQKWIGNVSYRSFQFISFFSPLNPSKKIQENLYSSLSYKLPPEFSCAVQRAFLNQFHIALKDVGLMPGLKSAYELIDQKTLI